MSDKRNQPNQEIDDNITAEVVGYPQMSKPDISVPSTLKGTKRSSAPFTELFKKTGRICVKPFIDSTKDNMGLQNYNMAVFPGTYHEEQLAAIERNGVVRYITGLDEFAPEVQNIKDPEIRESVIYNIRSVVAHLEKMLATNVLDVNDKNFWDKVKLLRPENLQFWGKISIRCGNEPVFLDPANDPFDLIKFMAIEAGGFDLISKSYDDALALSVAPKFYLDKETHTVSVKTTEKRLHNQATSQLDKLANGNPVKLLYITKMLDTNSATYKNSTPVDVLYDVLDDYISGKGVESSKKRAAEHFIEVSELDMETLKLKALVKDATFYKIISLKADGMLYHTATSTMLGRNVSDVVLYLKNPLNEEILTKLLQEIDSYWNL